MAKPVSPVLTGSTAQETVYTSEDQRVGDLPSLSLGGPEGVVLTRWRFDWRERFRILFRGDCWIMQQTFYDPLQPLAVSGLNPTGQPLPPEAPH